VADPTTPSPWQRLRAHPPGWGATLVVLLLVTALNAPLLAPYSPTEQLDPRTSALRPPGTRLAAVHLKSGDWQLADRIERVPNGLWIERRGERTFLAAADVANLTAHGVADRRWFLLGSDDFGRDVTSRLLYGARISLGVGLIGVLLALTLGVALGALAATGGAFWDTVTMRTIDGLLAFPWLFLMIALAALLRPSALSLVVMLGATSWMSISRLVRAELLGLDRRDFVLAARALGESRLTVLLRHMLPNAMTPAIVRSALLVGRLILAESALSFLGLGVQPPTPTWGGMISDAYSSPFYAWWLALFPGALLALTVIAFGLLSDDLRDRLDPRT
jgi:peptide/nickel transport system permease protein